VSRLYRRDISASSLLLLILSAIAAMASAVRVHRGQGVLADRRSGGITLSYSYKLF